MQGLTRRFFALVSVIAFGALSHEAHAVVVRGTGTAALIGGDLTDPENNGEPDANVNYNATFAASEEPGFGAGELAFNVFDNQVGGDAAKWCCGDQNNFPANPISVQATFGQPYRLTTFTLTSGNDSPERQPRAFEIQGSNDGTNFTSIYTRTDTATSPWTTNDQVLQFDAGTDFLTQSQAYSTFRFITTATGTSTGARFQLGEIEFFGTPVPEPTSVAAVMLAAAGVAVRRRRTA